jgi:transcriptional regulator with XRE-family HTH domain/DNA-binding IscR family transcriptional regulator
MNIYEIEDYKTGLREIMAARRLQFGSRFTFEKMAEACGVQKTYLSKVLNSSAHLNPDQLFASCDYLKLSAGETEFLLLVRESQVALNAKRVALLNAKIKAIHDEHLKTESAIDVVSEGLVENHRWEYYTDTDLQLVHLFLTVPAFAKDPESICEKIGISKSRLENILLKLQKWELVRFEAGGYKAKDPKMHLSEDSPVFLTFGILNRIKTIEKLRQTKIEKSDDYFFSVVFSAESKYQNKLKKKILDLLRQTQSDVSSAKPEEVYQFNIDLFRWS